jgi:hypothetical protein
MYIYFKGCPKQHDWNTCNFLIYVSKGCESAIILTCKTRDMAVGCKLYMNPYLFIFSIKCSSMSIPPFYFHFLMAH